MAPDAVAVTAMDNFQLFVSFENGRKGVFDVRPLLSRKCYARLANEEFFKLASIQYGCVSWPEDIDIDPDWLYEDTMELSEWDPDFTKLTPAEAEEIAEAVEQIKRGEVYSLDEVDLDALAKEV